jgi:hypothetical protein
MTGIGHRDEAIPWEARGKRSIRPVLAGWMACSASCPYEGHWTMSTNDKPHPHAGNSPESRARQLANLTPRSAVKHGSYSAELLAPERERVLAELLASFPGVRRDRLELAAAQRARITLLQAYIDTVGIVKHRLRGDTYPAVDRLQREEVAYRAELSKIEELARQRAPFDALAELADDEGQR